ncbi:MAG: hypothetical protein HOI01_10080 [Proteobacteria bacterium]|jgi:hypothetical protein|nr:hypothetical protein [Pseudomonadota bacterium]
MNIQLPIFTSNPVCSRIALQKLQNQSHACCKWQWFGWNSWCIHPVDFRATGIASQTLKGLGVKKIQTSFTGRYNPLVLMPDSSLN